ncbi:MAG: F0F1 ATP synthase subunit B [Alphaproteobacteria bacterium]|nr:F0F1 ATP synthase subunit B [Alphaproteobacteria bacterium]
MSTISSQTETAHTSIAAAHEAHTVAAHGTGAFYLQPEFWVAVAFFIVVGFAFRRVVHAVSTALDLRAEKIKGKLDEARRLRDDAQVLLVEYQRKQRDAMKEAEDIVAYARAEALRLKKEAAVDLEEAIKRREAQAMARISQAEAQAIAEVRNTAVDIAIAATRHLIAEHLTKSQANALIEQTIQELPKRLLQ